MNERPGILVVHGVSDLMSCCQVKGFSSGGCVCVSPVLVVASVLAVAISITKSIRMYQLNSKGVLHMPHLIFFFFFRMIISFQMFGFGYHSVF